MRASLVVVVCLFAALEMQAQSVATVAGTVRARADSSPLARAQVTVRGGHITSSTNDSGIFVLDRAPVGVLNLQVRRLGFRALDTAVTIGADSSLVVWLMAVPRRLAEVEVRGRRIMIPAHMREIIERADRNHGTLITADDIERVFPQDAKSMLYGIAGIRVETTRITFVRCSNPANGATAFQSPKVHVYVNGSRHTVSGDSYEAREVIQSVHPKDIEMMEVYGGVTRIPAEFLVDACAVVAIWTKAY
jgi:hypothetical protein